MINGIATESVARKCLGVLKTILNEAKGDGLIQGNPAQAPYAMPSKGTERAVKPVFDYVRGNIRTTAYCASEGV